MESPIVDTHLGQLRGSIEININGKEFVAFKGIPYAKPPVGHLRFKDPIPPEPWTGIRDAQKFGDDCAQLNFITRAITGSDDCLYLNVYTLDINLSSPKAVMVWIHGGGFVIGSGDDNLCGPDYLIEKDIVLVTINYRLGILGFLNLEDEVAPGNQGLKDQVAALQWIRRNISQFGGDPENVTIFGESAGGASVHYLALSPLSQGLFNKAILQSGVAINPWASIPGSPKRFAEKIVSTLGKETSDPVEIVNFLRTIDVETLIATQTKMSSPIEKIVFINPFGPGIDSSSSRPFLSVSLGEAIKSGIRVPCMAGYTSGEGLISIGGITEQKLAVIEANYENNMLHPTALRILREANASTEEIKKRYFGDEEISMKNTAKFADLQGDFQFVLGIHDVVDIQAKTSRFPTYLYKFDVDMGKTIMKLFTGVDLPGTCHGEDLQALFHFKLLEKFGRDHPAPGSLQHLLIQRFTELWTNFAKTGNPTPQTSHLLPVIWKPVDDSGVFNCLMITETLSMGVEKNFRKEVIENCKNKL